uniref:Pre-mRNA-splicing factor 18 n=1 Tax=Ciona savignyi TaxID=51511 RepID=H2ZK04_CIOSA
AAIMKAETDRKRKVIENKNVMNPQKKYFKRGDLERKEREEYEEKHNIKKVEPEATTSNENKVEIATAGLDKNKLPMTLSRQEVVRRLRDRSEPIRLFGESDYEAFQRLRKLEIMAPDINKGLRNDFKVALDQLEQENIDELIKQQTGDDPGKIVTMEPVEEEVTLESLQKMSKNLGRGKDNDDCDVILKTMKFLLRCWAKELNEIPEEQKKGRWKTQSAIHRQTQTYLNPLFTQLKNKTVATDILEYLAGIIRHVLVRDYVKASAIYLQMAIGNAPWPIGVTMVGIHARTGREKIFSQQIAHVLNDETQRKFIQGLKRIMTACQRIFPTDPSKSLEYNATKS